MYQALYSNQQGNLQEALLNNYAPKNSHNNSSKRVIMKRLGLRTCVKNCKRTICRGF